MIKGNRELNKKKNQKQKLSMQYQEIDQSNVGLKTKHGQLENTVIRLKSSIGSPSYLSKGAADPNSSENNLNMWGKPQRSGVKTRSNNAMFGGETLVQQQERVQAEVEYAESRK